MLRNFNHQPSPLIQTKMLITMLQEVIQVEALCKQLYESQDASVRTEAEKALVAFQNSPDSLGNLGLIN